jgi:nicotinamidase-related amidase
MNFVVRDFVVRDKNVLIVIDVQKGFINTETKEIPEKIARHIENNVYDHLIFARFINNTETPFYKKLNWKECSEPPDIDIHEALQKYARPENTFDKGTYSVFKQKSLLKFLKENNINTVYLCGLDSDGCVLASSFEGFDLGLNITILTELTASSSDNKHLHEYALKIMKRCFV